MQPQLSNAGVSSAFKSAEADFLALKNLNSPDFESIAIVPAEENFAGAFFKDDKWVWPEAHFPSWTPSKRTINFLKPHDLRGSCYSSLNVTIKKFVMLLMFHPLESRSKLPTWQKAQRTLNEFAFDMVSKENCFNFGDLTPDCYRRLVEGAANGRIQYSEYLRSYLKRLTQYGRIGLIEDFPGKNSDRKWDQQINEPAPAQPDASQKQSDARQSIARIYEPFPDIYLSELGKRCDFYLRQIGPNLREIYRDHPDTETNRRNWLPSGRSQKEAKPPTIKVARERAWREFLGKYEWVGSDGNPLESVPFPCENLVFPPTRQAELLRLVSRHMDALVCILLLLSGGRASEVESLQRGTIQTKSGGPAGVEISLVNGMTFKPSASDTGLERNWPVPREVAAWIDNQSAVAAELGTATSQSLWFSMSTMHVGVDRISAHFRCTSFAKRHGLEQLANGSAHPHRFRKTIARLALLALTGAPTLVMVMFGHRDIGTTVSYLLSDPGIRDDLREMLGEFRVELGLNIMEALPESAGPAKKVLEDARDQFFDSLSVPMNQRSQRVRLLDFVNAKLIEGGFDLKVIYPGILCLRSIEQQGLCTRPGSPIDTSCCRSDCRHRLETSLRKEEVFSIIEDLLDSFSKDHIRSNILLLDWTKRQLLDHIGIFPDIKLHFQDDKRLLLIVSDT